jgi:hypothetical protein
MERAMTIWGSIINSMAHERMKLRMRVRLPKDQPIVPEENCPSAASAVAFVVSVLMA